MAHILNDSEQKQSDMKKIVIVDGGPRKNMNTAQLLQRLAFPWLSYNDYSLTAPKRMPVVLIETMNGTPERNNSNHFGTMEWCLTTALGEPERIIGYNTCQVAKYDNYELGSFSEEAKHAWRDAHWEEDLQRAYDAGRKMAEQ